MNSIAGSQTRTFLGLLGEFRPSVRTDRNLPARLQQRLARDRNFGSRDRRLYRELLYTAFRYWPWIEALLARSEDAAVSAVVWLAAEMPATRNIKEALLSGWPSVPSTVAAQAQQLGMNLPVLPEWFAEHCPEAFISPNLDVLQTRAPFWLRLQTDDPKHVFAEFAERGWAWRHSEILPSAVELLADFDVTQTASYKNGRVEIQDLGSQLLLEAVQVKTGGRWLDACAGAGGKTLQLARLLGENGGVEAHDPRREALEELRNRARRARLENISVLSHVGENSKYDGVLVDAPCSGSGTWRRAPHLKWCTTATEVTLAAARQREILGHFADNVAPGGVLVYATCSLSSKENEAVIANFLETHLPFTPAPLGRKFEALSQGNGLLFLPAQHNTDGFFVAVLQRNRKG